MICFWTPEASIGQHPVVSIFPVDVDPVALSRFKVTAPWRMAGSVPQRNIIDFHRSIAVWTVDGLQHHLVKDIRLTGTARKTLLAFYSQRHQSDSFVTLNSTGDDTVTSATSQLEDTTPDCFQRTSDSCPLLSTCMVRLSVDSAGNQYLNINRDIVSLTMVKSCKPVIEGTYQKRTHIPVVGVKGGVSSCAMVFSVESFTVT